MAIQLVRLRNVPSDELEELYALMEENDIEVYETPAGNWGISMPALWLRHDDDHARAKALLEAYEQERFRRMREEYESLRQQGKSRTFMDIARENPVRYILYIIMIGALVYISLVPFLSLIN